MTQRLYSPGSFPHIPEAWSALYLPLGTWRLAQAGKGMQVEGPASLQPPCDDAAAAVGAFGRLSSRDGRPAQPHSRGVPGMCKAARHIAGARLVRNNPLPGNNNNKKTKHPKQLLGVLYPRQPFLGGQVGCISPRGIFAPKYSLRVPDLRLPSEGWRQPVLV